MTEPNGDPLAFDCQPIPKEVTRVAGCNCGGLNMHLSTCTFFDLPEEEALANDREAHDRLDAYMAELNAGLRRD